MKKTFEVEIPFKKNGWFVQEVEAETRSAAINRVLSVNRFVDKVPVKKIMVREIRA